MHFASELRKAIDGDDDRLRALAALAPHLAPEQRDEAITEAVDTTGFVSRDVALTVARDLALSTFEHGGQTAIVKLFHTIKDVCRWYP